MSLTKENIIDEIVDILENLPEHVLNNYKRGLDELYQEQLNASNDAVVYIAENAFWSLLLSAIEVYKKETFGILLGSYSYKEVKYNVQYAIGFQAVKRSYSYVKQSARRDRRIKEFLHNLPQLELIGHFHSHADGPACLSKTDKGLITDNQIMLLIDITNKSKSNRWRYRKDGSLAGTVNGYSLRLIAYYNNKNEQRIRKAKIICPYGFGFQHHLRTYR